MTGGTEADEGSNEHLNREPTSSKESAQPLDSNSKSHVHVHVKTEVSQIKTEVVSRAQSGSDESGHHGTQARSRRRTEGSVSSSSPMTTGDELSNPSPKVWLSEEELGTVTKEDLQATYRRLQVYFDQVKRKAEDDLTQAKESEEKHRSELVEVSRRHKVLLMRLTTRERQLSETEAQISELKKSITPSVGALRSTLLDPAVNLIITKMKKEFEETKKKLEDTQSDLNAWKFTPDSNTGKRLMSKCRMLYQENEELGKMISSGRLAKLESDLALQKSLTVEMKKSQSELDELVQELDEDVEGMQSTICYLQQQLREANKGSSSDSSSQPPPPTPNSNNTCADPAKDLNQVNVNLAQLCAQCRTTVVPEDTKLRTRPPLLVPERPGAEAEVGMDLGDESEDERRLVVDERPCVVNGEISTNHHRTKCTSNANSNSLSVQNVVNSTVVDSGECDGIVTDSTDAPVAKRTKLLEVTTTTTDLVITASDPPNIITTTVNGNGSMEH